MLLLMQSKPDSKVVKLLKHKNCTPPNPPMTNPSYATTRHGPSCDSHTQAHRECCQAPVIICYSNVKGN